MYNVYVYTDAAVAVQLQTRSHGYTAHKKRHSQNSYTTKLEGLNCKLYDSLNFLSAGFKIFSLHPAIFHERVICMQQMNV